MLDQSQRLPNPREREKERTKKVVVAEESVSTAARRATGRVIVLSTWLQESKV